MLVSGGRLLCGANAGGRLSRTFSRLWPLATRSAPRAASVNSTTLTSLQAQALLSRLASAQAAPHLDDGTISVVVPGQAISPYRQETMGFIVDVISHAVLDAAGSWLAANPGQDPGAPFPVVMLQLQPPNLMFSLRTDT